MSELPPEIPPWSPLVGRDPTAATIAGETAGDASVSSSDGDSVEPGTAPTARPSKLGRVVTALAALAVLAIVAASLAALGGTAEDVSPPSSTARRPVPATTWEQPAPLGTMVSLGNGWNVTVGDADLQASDAVQPLNPDHPLPAEQVYVLVQLTLYYLDGAEASESPFYGVDLGLVGDDGRLVTPADSPCIAPEPALDLETELARGESASGRICFAVDAASAPALRLVAQPSMSFGARTSYLALSPAVVPQEGS